MDLQMPNLGGVEATGIIRKELGGQIKIIAMTGETSDRVEEELISKGFNGYLAKLIDPGKLLELLNTVAD